MQHEQKITLTGKWPVSEDTLSDTYMMFPSVVNAIRKPSRACKRGGKLGLDNEASSLLNRIVYVNNCTLIPSQIMYVCE